jgi:hypothetical protein
VAQSVEECCRHQFQESVIIARVTYRSSKGEKNLVRTSVFALEPTMSVPLLACELIHLTISVASISSPPSVQAVWFV